MIAIAAAISPYRACREELRSRISNFIEIYMHCPVDVLVERDVKGLYKKALAGEIPHFTGISDPYEAPDDADVVIDTSVVSRHDAVAAVLDQLTRGGWLG